MKYILCYTSNSLLRLTSKNKELFVASWSGINTIDLPGKIYIL